MQVFNIQISVVLFSLIESLYAQTLLSYEDAQGIAWRSYGSFVTQFITAGQPIRPGIDYVFVNPPTTAAIRGGTPCPESVTNSDLFAFADALQSGPLLDTSGPGYNQALDYYLGSVDLGTVNLTPAQVTKIQQFETTVSSTTNAFSDADNAAYTKYLADVRAQSRKQTFESWVVAQNPVWTTARDNMENANAALKTYKLNIYGPAYNTITKLKDKLELLSQDTADQQVGSVTPNPSAWVNGSIPSDNSTDASIVSYNMPAYGGNYNVQFKPFAQHTLTDGIRYDPLYTLTGGFEEACDSWINGTAGTFSYTWSMRDVNARDWSSLGHTTSSVQVGGSLYSILSGSHGSSTDTTTFNSWNSAFSTSISMQLTMKGAPIVFNVNAGPWDVPDVRRTFPKLISKGIDQLSNHTRITKILVGHQVACNITISDLGTWKSVSQFVQDYKKDTSAGLSIFGFHFGGSGGGITHRNITDVQTYDGQNGGTIVIPASPAGIPMMLGAMGKAL